MEHDNQFELLKITKSEPKSDGGYTLTFEGGFCFRCPDSAPIEPKAGMTAKLYGKGFGFSVRGLVIDGHTVFYRTEAEEEEYRDIQSYGKDAAEWLERWDAGRGVWSIEMGGLGPGYEQAIQITAAEILRHLLEKQYNDSQWGNEDAWKHDREEIERWSFDKEAIHKLGLSGAQFGAAMQIATRLYMDGPIKVMKNPDIQDRKIQVCKNFPSAV